ncbi:2-oxoglutarate dehydrogenase E1 component [Leucothrix arctica]|uniref:2-oxoglutarate dehydrogenase E1 component n=1 Tax=Leucothrix arctica TaxID=1481894 RepID=A0A317C499_9GAMM|nr:2-oxoglutarate dehydrogenase E1 component [Leucothrix arctica]PWQ93475.1 2-oxoglutarate dehydrogenase E1 component [Leucothrix arctica]
MATTQQTTFEKMRKDSMLDGSSAVYLESMYESYLEDPSSVTDNWRRYFDELPVDSESNGSEAHHSVVRDQFRNLGMKLQAATVSGDDAHREKQVKVLQLINSYRFLGHMKAKTNPLAEGEVVNVPELTLAYHSLSKSDLETVFNTGSLAGVDDLKLKDIVARLEGIYCDTTGAQYMYISNTEEKRWIQGELARNYTTSTFDTERRKYLLKQLVAAEGLERYLGSKYVGQKRFSLEGGDSLVPMLDELIQHTGSQGMREIVIGMAHRGRLNVLINIMGKSPAMLFNEFAGSVDNGGRSGDVKYHMGYSSDMQTKGGPVHLAMAFNPSHLEIVGPVVIGASRARQDRRDPEDARRSVMPIVIHGDAALAGQGVNMEMLNMSDTRGYHTHGTIHIVVNNQVGFTTSAIADARSTEYCTDIAKMIGSPVFHVNADDPEAVINVTRMAVDYRAKFRKDVFIDLVCYRRHGHNEADEPSATQPLMYKKIKARATAQSLYAERLIKAGVVTKEDVAGYIADYRKALEDGASTVPHLIPEGQHQQDFPINWARFGGTSWDDEVDTTITEEAYKRLGMALTTAPEGFRLNARVKAVVKKREQMANLEAPADWGFGENLAYASILDGGNPIRISGEDVGRGTFFHRHAVFHEQDTGKLHIPLEHIDNDPKSFAIIDSLLSEEAVLAFEYGYAATEADKLVIWEAQFGDFANGAQMVIDQFISSAHQKWALHCGLVMLLPHGYEGMGPEHSSARLERFMQLCAQENMQVCVPSTPAQIFHMLRRQICRDYRTPLIVMTPKSLLRHPAAVNEMADFTEHGFQNVIDEVNDMDVNKVTDVILCSGKIYYELLDRRNSEALEHVAIVRVEQLYPFPAIDLDKILAKYPNIEKHIWVQEEPFNQGAWLSIQPAIREVLGEDAKLVPVTRASMAAPAEGSHKAHVIAQEKIIVTALGLG